jgi:hypothetical protein
MLADNIPLVDAGRLDREIHLPSEAKLELVNFIAEELPRWRDHPDRPHRESETGLTEHLADHLNSATAYSHEWSHVQFRCETSDEAKPGRKIDLTIKPKAAVIHIAGRRHSQFDALFPIEAKRLPTPREKDRDEREYVITDPGSTGGIQRFKFGHHGSKHDFAAMIGYVQEGTFEGWLDKMNGWIGQLAKQTPPMWTIDDSLRIDGYDSKARICRLHSLHARHNLTPCPLKHLWIQIS